MVIKYFFTNINKNSMVNILKSNNLKIYFHYFVQ